MMPVAEETVVRSFPITCPFHFPFQKAIRLACKGLSASLIVSFVGPIPARSTKKSQGALKMWGWGSSVALCQ